MGPQGPVHDLTGLAHVTCRHHDIQGRSSHGVQIHHPACRVLPKTASGMTRDCRAARREETSGAGGTRDEDKDLLGIRIQHIQTNPPATSPAPSLLRLTLPNYSPAS